MTDSEIKALGVVDKELEPLDPGARKRILRWAWEKYGAQKGAVADSALEEADTRRVPGKAGAAKKKKGKGRRAKSRPTIVKDLNLFPKGKQSFIDFAAAKQPADNQEKCAVAVYYLKQKLSRDIIDVNHVYTCFKVASWRTPADLENTLALTAFRKRWLDTSNLSNITLTTLGENFVEHDLPRGVKGTKA